MAAPTQAVIDAIMAGKTRVTRRAEIYESDGLTLWRSDLPVNVKAGSVSVDSTREERRNLDLTLDNSDHAIVHDPNSGLWYDKIIKAYRGVILDDGTSWETQLGEFMIDTISEPNFPNEIKITARDYTKKMLNTKLDVAVTFAWGTQIDTLVKSLAALAGITRFKLNAQGAILTATSSFDRETDYWSALKTMCDAANIELYFDSRGFLTTRHFLDPVLSPVTLVLQTGPDAGNLVSFTKQSDDSRLYNYVVVTATSESATATGGILFQTISQNINANSPTRIARIGRRSYYYSSSMFTNKDQCQKYGDRLLKVTALESYNLDFSSLVFPWLESGEIVQYIDPNAATGEPDRYLLSNFSVSLALGPMAGNAKRVTIVGT